MKMPKRTIDIQVDNDRVLEMMKQEYGQPYGTTINGLIRSVCRAPEKVRSELISFIKQRLISLDKQMHESGEFVTDSLREEADAYRDIAMYLNRGRDIEISNTEKEISMIRIDLKDGYMIAPDNWIILNREDAGRCSYAHVVEVNQGIYDVEFPHFVYFHNYESSEEYEDNLYDLVNDECAKAFPKYQAILDYRNSHPTLGIVLDPEDPGTVLNETEIDNYPHIGHFPVYVQGDPRRPGNYKPPYGARIVRQED